MFYKLSSFIFYFIFFTSDLEIRQQEHFDPLEFWMIRTVHSETPNDRYSIIRGVRTVCSHLCKATFKLNCFFKITNKTIKAIVKQDGNILGAFAELSPEPQMHDSQANGAHGLKTGWWEWWWGSAVKWWRKKKAADVRQTPPPLFSLCHW